MAVAAAPAKKKSCCLPFKFWTNNKQFGQAQNQLIRNGNMLQEELISFCNGKSYPIRFFSTKEIMGMTNFNLNSVAGNYGHSQLFKGVNENRPIYVKRFTIKDGPCLGLSNIIHEIVVATQMSAHKNVLRLLGCCIETEFPILVYEFPQKGCLVDPLRRAILYLPWKIRLRIGKEVAYAISYLHNAFSRPIIYRNLSAKDVFLDKDNVAKLTGFYLSISIPEGQMHVQDVVIGSIRYAAPEYLTFGRLTQKSDVFCFGVFLIELLSDIGVTFVLETLDHIREQLRELIDPTIMEEVAGDKQQQLQLQEVVDLVFICTAQEEDSRPSMVDVAVQLKKIVDLS